MVIEGVVLTAGLSQRAGAYKMTLKIGDKTIIEKCIEGMYDICSRIIVVGGYKVENIACALSKYSKIEIVINKDYMKGMFSSVKEGFRHVRADRFFFIPGDYPMVSSSVYEKMISVDGDIVIPLYNGEKGHPVLIKGSLAAELVDDSTCNNLRDFIRKKGFVFAKVQEPGVLMDIDTAEDYNEFKDFPAVQHERLPLIGGG